MNAPSKDGTVNIHGKTYLTVALRVSNFRDEHPDWGIVTSIHSVDAEVVIMQAKILNPEGRVIGTGYAEERRDSSQINRTSALENCETSAIGRALAACGYGGTEYASANEVENAIHQQKRSTSVTAVALDGVDRAPEPLIDEAEMAVRKTLNELSDGNIDLDGAKSQRDDVLFSFSVEEKIALWQRFSSSERSAIKKLKLDW